MLRKIAFLILLSGIVHSAGSQGGSPARIASYPGYEQTLQLPEPHQLQTAEPQTVFWPTSEQREGLIHVDVAARDLQGDQLKDLMKTDVSLLQDGITEKILSFRRSDQGNEEQRLNEVCLVIDEVDLSPKQFALVKAGLIDFLRRNHGVLAQPVSLLWIKPDGVYRSPFSTTDWFFLADDITSGHVVPTDLMFHPKQQPFVTRRTGGDLPADATLQSSLSLRDILWSDVLKTVYAEAVKWSDKPGRKALIWVGYGWSIRGTLDTTGGAFPVLVELATRMLQSRMVLYDVSPWNDPEIETPGRAPEIDDRDFLSVFAHHWTPD